MSKKTVVRALLAGGLAIGVGGAVAQAKKGANEQPSEAAVAFAKRTSDLMTNTVVAALTQEINETTPQNVAEGNLSIGLIFNDQNRDMRLVGTRAPLSDGDRPADDFEKKALELALKGKDLAETERVQGQWYYRRSVPLSNFKPQCAMCHANFAGVPATEFVGALMLRVPVKAE